MGHFCTLQIKISLKNGMSRLKITTHWDNGITHTFPISRDENQISLMFLMTWDTNVVIHKVLLLPNRTCKCWLKNESCDRKKTSFELVEWAYNKLLGTFSDIVPWLADFFKHWLLLRRMTKSAIPTPRRCWLAKSLSHHRLDLTRTQSFTRVIVWRSILTLFRLFGTIFFSFQSC